MTAPIEAGKRLTGQARRKVWADLDVWVMRDYAPVAAFGVEVHRDFVSARVGCHLHHPVMGFDIAAACVK